MYLGFGTQGAEEFPEGWGRHVVERIVAHAAVGLAPHDRVVCRAARVDLAVGEHRIPGHPLGARATVLRQHAITRIFDTAQAVGVVTDVVDEDCGDGVRALGQLWRTTGDTR